MYTTPDIMRLAGDLARHSAARLAVTAENTANADTPGYKARDISAFEGFVAKEGDLRATRHGHIAREARTDGFAFRHIGGEQSMNGNDVNLEAELVRSTQARSGHTLALAVYSASLDILRTASGRGR